MTRLPPTAAALRHRSAWLPVAISLFFVVLALRHVAIYGPGMAEDEGAEARLSWLPRSPRLALGVLAAQLVAASAVIGLVYWLEHA